MGIDLSQLPPGAGQRREARRTLREKIEDSDAQLAYLAQIRVPSRESALFEIIVGALVFGGALLSIVLGATGIGLLLALLAFAAVTVGMRAGMKKRVLTERVLAQRKRYETELKALTRQGG